MRFLVFRIFFAKARDDFRAFAESLKGVKGCCDYEQGFLILKARILGLIRDAFESLVELYGIEVSLRAILSDSFNQL